MVGLFVFIDKYSGPLGNAAVEAALLLSIAGATNAAATGTKETASLWRLIQMLKNTSKFETGRVQVATLFSFNISDLHASQIQLHDSALFAQAGSAYPTDSLRAPSGV